VVGVPRGRPDKLFNVRRVPTTRIVEGEVSGFPVPGGWPDRGPFKVLSDLLRRRRSTEAPEDENTTSTDDEAPR
jgi:hypothetical protein